MNWNKDEYSEFCDAITIEGYDCEDIANYIETKTPSEVELYMSVFLKRFFELKSNRDEIIMRFRKEEFQKEVHSQIENFDPNKNYTLFLQEDLNFKRESYLEMMKEAQAKRMKEVQAPKKDLEHKLDHYIHSLSKHTQKELVKKVSHALSIEDELEKHINACSGPRYRMKKQMAISRVKDSAVDGLYNFEKDLIADEYKEVPIISKRGVK